MNTKELKQLLHWKQEEIGGKKPPKILIWSIIAAIAFLAFGSFSGGEKVQSSKEKSEEKEVLSEAYITKLEKRLVAVLEKIEGAGEVSVFLSFESGGEKILAIDEKTENEEASAEREIEEKHQKEQTVVLKKDTVGENPYVIENRLPQPTGVLVIAKGARSEPVKQEIYEAVKALFGLSAHRIKVAY